MSYRALFTADVHAANNLPFAERDPNTLVTDRLGDVIYVLKTMGTYADKHSIEDIWIVGDLIDRRLVDAVTLKMTTQVLAELKQRHRLFIVPGNHEADSYAARHFTVDLFTDMGIYVVGGASGARSDQAAPDVWEPVDDFRVAAMPYMPPSRALQAIERLGEAQQHVDLLLVHQTIKGGEAGEWVAPDGLDPEVLASIATTTLGGHFHRPQSVIDRVHFLGAPMQHNFGDRGESRGFWDVNFGPPVKRLKVKLSSPLFHELIWRVGEERPSWDTISQNDYVNLRISGSRTEVKKLWKAAETMCEDLKSDVGVRYAKPIEAIDPEPMKQRIVIPPGQKLSFDQVLSRYLDGCDVTGLDRARLESIGRALLQDAEK